VSKGNDIAVVGTGAVYDNVRESTDGELAHSRSASPWRTNLRVSFDQVERTGDRVEQPDAPSWSAFFVPPHGFSEFLRRGLADLQGLHRPSRSRSMRRFTSDQGSS